jgi:hypothetical protein
MYDSRTGTVIFPSFQDSIDRLKLGGGSGGGSGGNGGGPFKSDFNYKTKEEVKDGSVLRMFVSFLFSHYPYIQNLSFQNAMHLVSLVYVQKLLPAIAVHVAPGYNFKIDPLGYRGTATFEQQILQQYLRLTATEIKNIVGHEVRQWFNIYSTINTNWQGIKGKK